MRARPSAVAPLALTAWALLVPAPRALAQAALSLPTSVRPALWKVSAPEARAYLFGTLHVGTKDIYPLPEAVREAFAASKALVVEIDIGKSDPAAMQAIVMQRGLYAAGDSLAAHVKKSTLERLRAYLKEQGIPFADIERLKPWLAALSLVTLDAQRRGLDPKLSVDAHLLQQARGKQIIELETIESQLDVLAGSTPEEQETGLLSTITSMAELPALVEAWARGDDAAIEALLKKGADESPEAKRFLAKLFDERNKKMLEKIEDCLKAKAGDCFVAVGAGHLVGEKGLVRLLEAKGYKVERIAHGPGAPAPPTGQAR